MMDTSTSFLELLRPPDALGRLGNKTPEQLAADFELSNSMPSHDFADTVWRALIQRGAELPEDIRPGPPRPWQSAALHLQLDFAYSSLQGARQGAGKTFVAALVIACHLLLGSSVTVAMPTYRQGSSILVRRVLLFMQLLEGLVQIKRTCCNKDESAWDNGARLTTLSTSSGGRRGTQGWTSRVVVIDESHEVAWRDMAWFMPLVALAMKRGCGRIMLLGVGADELKAPAQARLMPEYASLVLDDATLCEIDRQHRSRLPDGHPELLEQSWSDFFERERALWDEDYYRQFYQCESPGASRRKIFERVPEMAVFNDVAAATVEHFLGVDVGKQRDQTVVAVLEKRGQLCNLVDVVRLPLGLPYSQQARELAALAKQWNCPPGRFAVEVNGPGQALLDVLVDWIGPSVPHATGMVMTTQRKIATIAALQSDIRHGVFGVAQIPLRGSRVGESGVAGPNPVGTAVRLSAVGTPFMASASMNSSTLADRLTPVSTSRDPCLGPTIRQHLAALGQVSTDEGAVSFDHSDILSALIVARSSMFEIVSI
ncbi:MAG: terminase family protein [bacterium]|nr:terminase family protein [bacterium]